MKLCGCEYSAGGLDLGVVGYAVWIQDSSGLMRFPGENIVCLGNAWETLDSLALSSDLWQPISSTSLHETKQF